MFTHAIITFTKAHVRITQAEYDALRTLSAENWFETNSGQRIRGSAIAEVVPIQDFYVRFPEEQPSDLKEFVAPPREEYVPLERLAEMDKQRNFSLLKGLRKFCEENSGANFARQFYEKKLALYKQKHGLSKPQ